MLFPGEPQHQLDDTFDRVDDHRAVVDGGAAADDRLAAADERREAAEALSAAEAAERAAVAGLEGQAIIGQAQGVIMARLNITPDAAFTYLVAGPQGRNVKLRYVAVEIVKRHSS